MDGVIQDSYDIESLYLAEGSKLGLIDILPNINPNNLGDMTVLELWKKFFTGKGIPWAVTRSDRGRRLVLWKPRVE